MARQRMIHPSFWESPKHSGLSVGARLLFVGLFSNADDDGRLLFHPGQIKGRIFWGNKDISEENISEMFQEILDNTDSVCCYNINENKYVCFLDWFDWQTVNRPRPSIIPIPPIDYSSEKLVNYLNILAKNYKNYDKKLPEIYLKLQETINEYSLKLASPKSIIEASLNDHGNIIEGSGTREVKLVEVKLKEEKGSKDTNLIDTKMIISEEKDKIPPKPKLVSSNQENKLDRKKLPIRIQEQTTEEMWDIYIYAYDKFKIKPLVWNEQKIRFLTERLINFTVDQIKTAISNLSSDKKSIESGFARFDWLIKSDENIENWLQFNSDQAKKESEENKEQNLPELAREIDERLVPGYFDHQHPMAYETESKEMQLKSLGFLNPEIQARMIESVGFLTICESTGNIFFDLLNAGKQYMREKKRETENNQDGNIIGKEEAKTIFKNLSKTIGGN